MKYKKESKEGGKMMFLWRAVMPYKWWYLLMMQAPFANGFHTLLYNYSIKLLIDLLVGNDKIDFNLAFWPVFLFIFSSLYLEIAWRLHNMAAWKAMPYIMKNIMTNVNDYLFNHSYQYFQERTSGSIISKVKGINDGVQKIHNALEYQMTAPVIMAVFTGVALLLINLHLFFIVILFSLLQSAVSIFFGRILNQIEQDKEDSWHNIIGKISDNIANIFTVFSYSKVGFEKDKIAQNYDQDYLPKALKWHKIDFIMSCITAFFYSLFVCGLIIYLIYLRNNLQITIGDIAYSLSLTYVFTDNMWRSINAIKDFSRVIANFKSSFSIMQDKQIILDKKIISLINWLD